jgi:hypothetical protein
MKVDTRTQEQKDAERQKWRRIFAWFPVRVSSGEIRWMETIERRELLYQGPPPGTKGFWMPQARALGQEAPGYPPPPEEPGEHIRTQARPFLPQQPSKDLTPYIYSFEHKKAMHIADTLEHLAGTSLGTPYNEMKFAAEYIRHLERKHAKGSA